MNRKDAQDRYRQLAEKHSHHRSVGAALRLYRYCALPLFVIVQTAFGAFEMAAYAIPYAILSLLGYGYVGNSAGRLSDLELFKLNEEARELAKLFPDSVPQILGADNSLSESAVQDALERAALAIGAVVPFVAVPVTALTYWLFR